MDQDTVDEIKKHFDGVSGALRQELRESAEETKRHSDGVAAALRQELRESVEETKRHSDGVAAALRQELRESVEETKRHFGVVAEALRSDVRGVAEGLALLTQRVDGVQSDLTDFKQEVRREFEDTRGMIRLSYSELDHRLRDAEKDLRDVKARLAALETRG